MIEPTAEMEAAYKAAWKAVAASEGVINCSEHDMGDCPYHKVPGARRRAGLAAVLAIVERDRAIEATASRWRCNRTERCFREDGHDGRHSFVT